MGSYPEERLKVLTRNEVAERLRVHPTMVTRWVKMGLLHCHRLGGRVLFLEREVLKLFDNHLAR